jgi:hypothetical protein
VLAALAGGCSTNLFSSKTSGTTSAASGSVPFGNRISALFGSSSAPASAVDQTPTSEEFDCPRIDIRAGASTLLSYANPEEQTALNVRYQGSFVRGARECRVMGNQVNIKIGVQGRVIVGPAGTPGTVVLPLRYALVHETVGQSKPVWTKLTRLNVEIPPQTPSVLFTHIEEEMTVPIPPAYELQDYVIYIGFDPAALEPEPKRPARPAPGRRPRTG